MGRTSTTDELADVIRLALAIADEMRLGDVALRLDAALVELTGTGVAPRPIMAAANIGAAADCDLGMARNAKIARE